MPASPTPVAPVRSLDEWVAENVELLQPDRVVWIDGSRAQLDALLHDMVEEGRIIRLNPEHRPYSFLARSDPDDVARVEARTFICSEREEDAGPTNNWREPEAMREELRGLFAGAMRGRTMYVLPFSMGPVGGALSRYGVQLTDSAYVVASMSIMTRVGDAVLERIRAGARWVPALHSVGAPLEPGDEDVAWPSNPVKYICHFPETREIVSFGSAYGGNAILAKKSFALRIASVMARDEGWLAEHMLLLRVTDPRGRRFHIAAAFPSACGKTNFAMLRSALPGWQVETLGDDIAWLAPGSDGRLRAINPEAGFFGVAPGTGPDTNPTAIDTLWGNTIFTNVALREDGDVWWEGLTKTPPAGLTDWRGEPWTPDAGRPAAHPNSRFTVAASQCPSIAPDWDDPNGVPIDAIIFGGRRATNVPLVVEARDWEHGVFLGATIASERTAAAEGELGELRRDPFAMLPFCGYNMADYMQHWLDVGTRLRRTGGVPGVYQVNWFRKDADGKWLWPGFGENGRVLAWIVERIAGEAPASDTPLGRIPAVGTIDYRAAGVGDADWQELFRVDAPALLAEADDTEAFLDRFGDKLPEAVRRQLAALRERLGAPRRAGKKAVA
ncbi:phosphoenolpyruvate carboxykinase (GTP) [Protaetiibacter intestinalis]|uniref:Phosphoenolpyruvate carboxykinase [GTP] n=1 Tax=Protaetiibacter intestinalis TaxID=2419774 RepID=A0A387B4H5_9MICO|nr:phosphoenolpyruvate carboxykinase (GTP) [Protaetiibacter intestinalis]AYF97323.1 phosphoenolpyruvate carboxykinase (GTP) [Protaetiibacter intestinalis]